MKGSRGRAEIIVFIDCNSVINPKGQMHKCTMRRVDCDVLCNQVGCFPNPANLSDQHITCHCLDINQVARMIMPM